MRVLRGRAGDPDADEALTVELLDRAGQSGTPLLRVWRPHRHLGFGRRDARSAGFDRAREAATEAGFTPIVRATGGRAVAYTGTTVAVAYARPIYDLRTGLTDRYDEALQAIQRALWRLGVPAQRGEPADTFCPGGHALSWSGKIVGVAQRVRQDAALVGAVVVVDGHDVIATVLEPVYEALSIPFDPDTVGSISRAGGRADPDGVVEEVESAFVGEATIEVEHVGDDDGSR